MRVLLEIDTTLDNSSLVELLSSIIADGGSIDGPRRLGVVDGVLGFVGAVLVEGDKLGEPLGSGVGESTAGDTVGEAGATVLR